MKTATVVVVILMVGLAFTVIIVEKPLRDENAHKPSSISGTHQEKL